VAPVHQLAKESSSKCEKACLYIFIDNNINTFSVSRELRCVLVYINQ